MPELDIGEIQAVLPHRYPFLLVDRVREIEPDRRAVGIDHAKFRKPVVPGDQLRLELEVIRRRPPFWKMQGKAYVESELVCEAELTAMVTEEKDGHR